MYSYFILAVVLSLKTNSREKNFCIRKTTTTTTPIRTPELVTVTDKTLISQNLNIPSLHVIYVQQLLNERGMIHFTKIFYAHDIT